MTENEGQSSSRSVATTVWNPGLDSSNKNSSPIIQSSTTAPQLLPFPPPFALLAAAAHFRQQHQQNLVDEVSNQRCQQQNVMPKMHVPLPPSTSASFPFPPFTFPPPAFRLPPPPFPFMLPPPPPPQIPSPNFGQMAAAFMANLAANRQQQQMEMMNGGNGNNNGTKRRKKERAKWPILDNGSQSIENGQNGMSLEKSGEIDNAPKRNKRKGREIVAGREEFLYREGEEKDGLPSSTTFVANNNKRSRQNTSTNPIVESVLNEKPAAVNFNTCAICGISFRITTELVAHVRSNHRHTSRYDRQQRTSIGEAQLKEKLTMVKDGQRSGEWTVDEAEIQNNLQKK